MSGAVRLGGPRDPARLRRIVSLASARTEISSVRAWLFEDPRGTWESLARKLLESSEERACDLGLTEAQVDDQAADAILLFALRAELATARKRSK